VACIFSLPKAYLFILLFIFVFERTQRPYSGQLRNTIFVINNEESILCDLGDTGDTTKTTGVALISNAARATHDYLRMIMKKLKIEESSHDVFVTRLSID